MGENEVLRFVKAVEIGSDAKAKTRLRCHRFVPNRAPLVVEFTDIILGGSGFVAKV